MIGYDGGTAMPAISLQEWTAFYTATGRDLVYSDEKGSQGHLATFRGYNAATDSGALEDKSQHAYLGYDGYVNAPKETFDGKGPARRGGPTATARPLSTASRTLPLRAARQVALHRQC